METENTNEEYIGIIELNESVYHVVKRDNKLILGTGCNVGLLENYRMFYDDDFSMDENLQELIERFEEQELNEK